jgi:hypothetical protein
MKNKIRNSTILPATITLFLFLFSCDKKDELPYPTTPPKDNKPPKAIAGPDKTIQLPNQREFILSGEESSDPDRGGYLNFATSKWAKLSGPEMTSFSQTMGKASVEVLVAGQYVFEFTINDQWGLSAKDTVVVAAKWADNCNLNRQFAPVNSFLISVTADSIAQTASFTYSGSKLYFAGGISGDNCYFDPCTDFVCSPLITILDVNTGSQRRQYLSQARTHITSLTASGLVFFAGGYDKDGTTKTVDILDPVTLALTKTELSVARYDLAAVEINNKLLFAGGYTKGGIPSDIVDILDLQTRSWSSFRLSEARGAISVLSSGGKAYFVGGDPGNFRPATKTIDIYDASSGNWSVINMLKGRALPQLTALGDKMVIAGGGSSENNPNNNIEFFNTSTQIMTEDCFFGKSSEYYSIRGNNTKITSFGNLKFSIMSGGILSSFDQAINTWKISDVSNEMSDILLNINNQLITMKFVQGPWYTGKYEIYRLEY